MLLLFPGLDSNQDRPTPKSIALPIKRPGVSIAAWIMPYYGNNPVPTRTTGYPIHLHVSQGLILWKILKGQRLMGAKWLVLFV